jgi:3'(2'), 5'-bisphosphate nucleotidase
VALLEYGRPTGCMVLAPELGAGRTPLLLTVSPPDGRVHVDGVVAAPAPGTGAVSATRSSRRPPGAIERAARSRGIAVKTRATSQTLDMARTVLDLEPVCGIASFRAFVAEGQLVWDAAAGLALAAAMGRSAIDAAGRPLVPLAGGALAGPAPRLASTIVAEPRDQAWMLASR